MSGQKSEGIGSHVCSMHVSRPKGYPLKYFLIVVFLVAGLVSPVFADEYPLNDAHATRNLECADCHDTDKPTKRARMKACFGCHKNYEAIAKLTSAKQPNPHESHQGELECYQCHRPHKKDQLYCNQCHEFNHLKFQ